MNSEMEEWFEVKVVYLSNERRLLLDISSGSYKEFVLAIADLVEPYVAEDKWHEQLYSEISFVLKQLSNSLRNRLIHHAYITSFSYFLAEREILEGLSEKADKESFDFYDHTLDSNGDTVILCPACNSADTLTENEGLECSQCRWRELPLPN